MRKRVRYLPQRASGFSLIELVMVIAIMIVVAAIAVPRLSSAVESGQRSAFIRDAQIFLKGIDLYRAEQGHYPPTLVGDLDADDNGYIDTKTWNAPTPIGGRWTFRRNGSYYIAAILVEWDSLADAWSEDQMLLIDREFDDGDLSTGGFRKFNNTKYMVVVEGGGASSDGEGDSDGLGLTVSDGGKGGLSLSADD